MRSVWSEGDAVGLVAVALVVTGLLAHADVAAWWVLPIAVVLILGASLWQVAHDH